MSRNPAKRMCLLVVAAALIFLTACERVELPPVATVEARLTYVAISGVTPTPEATISATPTPLLVGENFGKSELSLDEYQLLRVLVSQAVAQSWIDWLVSELQADNICQERGFFMLGMAFGPMVVNDPLYLQLFPSPLHMHLVVAQEQRDLLFHVVEQWTNQEIDTEDVLAELTDVDTWATLQTYVEYLQATGYSTNVTDDALLQVGLETFGNLISPIPHHGNMSVSPCSISSVSN